MTDECFKEKWMYIISKYGCVKKAYILCEELDPKLKTNIQPLNEFRAGLDHVMKMMTQYAKFGDDDAFDEQYKKICSHLNRAFFDICDMLSINYRNKILKSLKRYNTDTINKVLPDYYNKWDAEIERICVKIANHRTQKGNSQEDELDLFEQYDNDIKFLGEVFKEILNKKKTLNAYSLKSRIGSVSKMVATAIIGAVVGSAITYIITSI